MAELNSKIDGVSYDELIGGTTIRLSTKVVTLAAGDPLKRGTLLGKVTKEGEADKDKYKIVDASKDDGAQIADCVLARDIGLRIAAENVETYRSGVFNRQRLIVAEGDTVEAHEEELRQKNILLTDSY